MIMGNVYDYNVILYNGCSNVIMYDIIIIIIIMSNVIMLMGPGGPVICYDVSRHNDTYIRTYIHTYDVYIYIYIYIYT